MRKREELGIISPFWLEHPSESVVVLSNSVVVLTKMWKTGGEAGLMGKNKSAALYILNLCDIQVRMA